LNVAQSLKILLAKNLLKSALFGGFLIGEQFVLAQRREKRAGFFILSEFGRWVSQPKADDSDVKDP